jgi:putative ABC transport system permease protein
MWIDDVAQDFQLAARLLARAPGFSAVVMAVLAVGIGVSVAMLTVANTVLFRPLPIQDPDRVVVLWGAAKDSIRNLPLTADHFARFRHEARLLEDVAGALSADSWPQPVRIGDRALLLNVGAVTGNYFDVLGCRPVVGRALRVDDDAMGAAPVAVISHAVWRRLFEGDPRVIGRRLTLHQRRTTYTIVGVAPPGLEFPKGTDVWLPFVPFEPIEAVPLGRLVPGATATQAAAELQASFRRDASGEWRDVGAVAATLPRVLVGDVRPAVLALSAAAGLLLLIGCVNAANLLLVRGAGRMQELAVRRALGAGRGRLVRQLSTESAVLGMAGGLLGAALAEAFLRGLVAIAPPELPRLEEIRLNGVALGLAAAVTIAAVVVCGVVPALWLTRRKALPVNDRSGTQGPATRRAHTALVVFQISVALVVVAAAGLLGRTLRELERLNTGFAADGLTVLQLAWPQEKFDTAGKVGALYDRLIPRIEALPDVVSAAPVNIEPFTGATAGWDGRFIAEGTSVRNRAPVLNMAVVGPAYFRTLGIPVLRGRSFTDADRERSPHVAIVSEAVARHFWPGGSPVGKRIAIDGATDAFGWWTVVGLVPETRYRAIREPAPTVYLPYRQFGDALAMVTTVAVRTTRDAAAAMPSVRRAVREIDRDVAVVKAAPMTQLLATQFAQPHLNALLTAVFGAVAVFLAGVGLYATLAYVVRQRTRELAIRHALGATPSRLRALVLKQALAIGATGIAAGLVGALAGGELLRSLLYGVSPADPLTLGGAAVLLLAVTVGASYRPAGQATQADAAAALRES